MLCLNVFAWAMVHADFQDLLIMFYCMHNNLECLRCFQCKNLDALFVFHSMLFSAISEIVMHTIRSLRWKNQFILHCGGADGLIVVKVVMLEKKAWLVTWDWIWPVVSGLTFLLIGFLVKSFAKNMEIDSTYWCCLIFLGEWLYWSVT